jgi:hypothetical protein
VWQVWQVWQPPGPPFGTDRPGGRNAPPGTKVPLRRAGGPAGACTAPALALPVTGVPAGLWSRTPGQLGPAQARPCGAMLGPWLRTTRTPAAPGRAPPHRRARDRTPVPPPVTRSGTCRPSGVRAVPAAVPPGRWSSPSSPRHRAGRTRPTCCCAGIITGHRGGPLPPPAPWSWISTARRSPTAIGRRDHPLIEPVRRPGRDVAPGRA